MMDVKEYQHHLAGLGYHLAACDGIYGPQTRESIQKFQREHRNRPDGSTLVVDGVWGPRTESALRMVIANNEPPVIEKPVIPDIPAGKLEKYIWDALLKEGFQPAGVAGIMGNLCGESALRPDNMEDQYQSKLGYTDKTYTQAVDNGTYTNFAYDAVGYGLAQWTWKTRKQGLLALAKTEGRSIADPGVQIAYLLTELYQQWPSLTKQLKTPGITVYEATRRFMVSFENPADKSEAAIQGRVRLAQIYFNRYT